MNPEHLFTEKDLQVLQRARETYGAHKQIGVAAEECTELAKELIKAFRYDSFDDVVRNTKENVVDEVADVLIVLDHVLQLFNITSEDLQPHIDKKLQRLEYWLNNSNSIEFTTKCRTVAPEDTSPVPEREYIPYDAFGDYSQEAEEIDLSELIETQKGVYENRFLRLFEMGDKLYREGQE